MVYQVRIKEHEGPLELLLSLIESRKLSINEVSLGSVAEEYFGYLEKFKNQENSAYHKEIASFLVVAATLMLIKSRSLLAGFVMTREEEDDVRELETRLAAYKAVKNAAALLGARVSERQQLFTRSAFAITAPSFLPPTEKPDLARMLGMLKSLLAAIPKKQELPQKTVTKIISIEEKIKELEKRIEAGMVKTFSDFVGQKKERVDVIVSFLAMLELIKLGGIVVRQSLPFDLIHIDHGHTKSA